LREPKRLDLGQAVNDLPLDQLKQLLGRKKLMIQYHGNVILLCHFLMANRHGDRLRFNVLLAEDYAELLIIEAELQGQKPSSFIRDLVYKHVKRNRYKVTLESTADTILKELEHD
jgi:hypothetical protein